MVKQLDLCAGHRFIITRNTFKKRVIFSVFTEKEYQIKDLMELYGITRDTIKYYETHGLIESRRKENGYRVFDEINVRKLKKILAFRDLGLTVEEVLQHCNSESITERTELMTKVRHRVEDELREINRKLNKIRELERSVSENFRYSDGFNIGYDLTICVNCPYATVLDRRTFAVVSAATARLSPTGELIELQDRELIRNKELNKECCLNCDKAKHYRQFYRCRIPYQNIDHLKRTIYYAYKDMKLMNYVPNEEIYLMRKVIKENGKDALILDTLIPFEPTK